MLLLCYYFNIINSLLFLFSFLFFLLLPFSAMRVTQNSSNHEVKYLRIIVDEYIRSGDSTQNNGNQNTENHPNHGFGNSAVKKSDKYGSGDHGNVPIPGFGRKNHIELGRHNLKVLAGLESEMGNVLCLISKEEDRQKLILQDLKKLLDTNKELFIVECSSEKKNVPLVASISTQADEKDSFGAINEEHSTEKSDDIDDSYTTPPNVLCIEHSSNLLQTNGRNVPYKLRALMSNFPIIRRIPPLEWLDQTIMRIYIDKINSDENRISQCLQKYELAENVYHYFRGLYGLPAVVDVQVRVVIICCY